MITTTTAVDIKAIVDSFFEANDLSWLNFKHICTDGAPAMRGAKAGFVALVKKDWPHITSSHCSLHRYALATKTLPKVLMKVMNIAIKVINFIRGRAKNHRIFQVLTKKWEPNISGFGFIRESDGCRVESACLGSMSFEMK